MKHVGMDGMSTTLLKSRIGLAARSLPRLALVLFVGHGSLAFAEQPKPVKVIIMSGQSNMVGFGRLQGPKGRWRDDFIDPVLSVYEGEYDPKVDYDQSKPIKTLKIEGLGGISCPYPGGGVQILRGTYSPKIASNQDSAVYRFYPGVNGDAAYNIMEVAGQEVYRREPGGEPVYKHLKANKGDKLPFKITYLKPNANGRGIIEQVERPDVLPSIMQSKGKYPWLMDKKGNWVKRDDVYYKGVTASVGSDWLSPLAGGNKYFGPEVGFGHVVGEHIDEPVLLLKTSQGNRSLGWDFLPPGSERYEFEDKIFAGYKDSPMFWDKGTEPKPINWYAGKQYDECFGAAHEVLNNFDENFPHWKGRGYEIIGFAWWQGDKDRYTNGLAARYEHNLAHLINTLRKEFKAPDAKFVIATLGQTPKDREPADDTQANEKLIIDGQMAVDGKTGKYPKFKGNVATVYTHPMSQGGASNAHYNKNAEVYMDVGLAMGEAMVELLGKEPKP